MEKRCLFFAFCTAIATTAFPQGRKVPLDKGFIENTIEYYYSTQAKQHQGTVFYIEKDSLTMNAKTVYSIFKVQFLSPEEAPLKLPKLQDHDMKLDRLMIKWITLDTIDVVITGCTVGERKVNHQESGKTVARTEKFLTNCTESFVDIPTCRFVYDRSTTKWSQINRGKYTK